MKYADINMARDDISHSFITVLPTGGLTIIIIMYKFLLLCILPAILATRPEQMKYGSQELVDYINNLGTTWKAGFNLRFKGVSHSVIQGMLGTWLRPVNLPIIDQTPQQMDVPETFDARQKWPNCPTIREIRDQSACGSCWAVGAAQAMSDRTCIGSNGKISVRLAAEDLMSCCWNCGMGCRGGYPPEAWTYWVQNGLVTGGNYSSKAGCLPYPFPNCEHHINKTTYKPCQKDLYPTPPCKRKCQSSYDKSYNDDKHYGKQAYGVSSQVEKIQQEIMTNGPVEVAYSVYADFLHYTGGVYQHKAGKFEGGHAVKMMGWGTEDGTPYWLIANSWNSDWGLKGYFKIIRGKDDCGIEGGVVAGLAKV